MITVGDPTFKLPFNLARRVRLVYCDPPRRGGYNDASDKLSYTEFQVYTINWLLIVSN